MIRNDHAEAKEQLAKLEQEQKPLALLKWKENDDNTVTISGIKDKSVETLYIPNYIKGKQVISLWSHDFQNGVFKGCINLKEIHLPDSLKSIGGYVFEGCSSLVEIHLPDSLKSIGRYAFKGCSSLVKTHLPVSLKSIDEGTFANCTNLKEIHLSNSLQSIGDGAFASCTSLNEIYLPDSLQYIGTCVFYNCKNLKRIYISSENYEKFVDRFPKTAQFKKPCFS